ncbi:MAG: transglycosylase SLT domain-containing protein, partial [Desulfuromonadaceae bacterium]|nr:transglycosylase SLT domain-containing protein [Desulfobulbus sp.]MDD2850266.1 transglycosylase SLT domain-containing protein [Desulfuromonadaceae bacterium]
MSNIYYDGMYAPKGGKYSNSYPLPKPDSPQKYDKNGKKIRRKLPGGLHSYYLLPIQMTPGRASGNSRRHGDASPEVQRKAIDTIIEAAKNHGLTNRETAHVLAIAFVESGFNPDAAAGTTTAAGLGQFVRKTGWGYGLDDTNRFELKSNADALVCVFRAKPTAVPVRCRPAFRSDGDQHSGGKPTAVPEQSDRLFV